MITLKNKIMYQDSVIFDSNFGLPQILNELTNVIKAPSFCIDLIFTLEPKMAIESGVPSRQNATII